MAPTNGSTTLPAIPKRKLGGVLEVPLLCLGTMTWGHQASQEEAHAQLDHALAQGLNFIDAAETYPVPARPDTSGTTERIIGNWLAKNPGVREKVVIATKVASYLPEQDRSFVVANRTDPPTPNAPQPRLDRANIRQALEASLKRLQTTYVDLYQLHWPARYTPKWGQTQYNLEAALQQDKDIVSFEEQVSAVGELIKEGKIRHWGLSNETSYGVVQQVETARRLGVPPPVSIQNDFALTYRDFDKDLAETCAPHHYNVHLLAYGALGGGALSDKYLGAEPPANARHTIWPKFQARYHCPAVLAAAKEYQALAKKEGITLAQLALAWAASRWYMGSVIIGANTLEQLKENIAAFTITLSPETLQAIEEIHLRRPSPAIAN